ncbi:MAG TPA: hypothetical protein ENH41_03495 [Candidatus Omnitrophica bacterium]|nr:hypothetical protein [Candidatus Omnitrophota bacterium]
MLIFPKELYQPIARFIQRVIDKPTLWDIDKYSKDEIPKELLLDEYTIELGKFIMMGEEDYFKDIIPVRMYGNKRVNISKDEIKKIALKKFELIGKVQKGEKVLISDDFRGIDKILIQK